MATSLPLRSARTRHRFLLGPAHNDYQRRPFDAVPGRIKESGDVSPHSQGSAPAFQCVIPPGFLPLPCVQPIATIGRRRNVTARQST
jgi:hypothetical protein